MRVGVPSERAARQEEAITEIPVAPTPLENFTDYAKDHPLRITAAAVAVPLFIRWALRRNQPAPTRRMPKILDDDIPGMASGRSSTFMEKSKAPAPQMKRAIPLKHETRAEAFDLLGNTGRKYIIVGGKGGVGKTSMSAAVATQFADRGQKTLIVSTDPAHSLSDAFGQSVGGGDPVPVMGIDNLYAQEVDPESMKRTFKMMQQNGGMPQMAGMEDMGLDDLNSLFETLPPGFDEAVALVEIIKYIEGDGMSMGFDRIVFDTAPTGHTLRLLSLPDFLNGFFGKIISMKSKFGRVMDQFKGMFGGADAEADMNASMDDMEELKRSMARVRDLFRDPITTEFIVATIPNMMAISESERLVEELRKEMIPVRHMFVNQVQPGNDDCTFCSARHKEHDGNMTYIKKRFEDLKISTVQCFDREIKGSAALRTMGSQLFPKEDVEDDTRPITGEDASATTPAAGSSRTPEEIIAAASMASPSPAVSDVPKAAAEVVE